MTKVFGSFTAELRDFANKLCREHAQVNCNFWEEKLTKEYLKCKDPKWQHFRTHWERRLVVEYGCMVWCTVFDTLRSKVGDKKADKVANDADFLFRKEFT